MTRTRIATLLSLGVLGGMLLLSQLAVAGVCPGYPFPC